MLRTPSTRYLALWSALSGLALLAHYFAAFLFIAEAVFLIVRLGWRRVVLPIGAVVIVGLALAPLAVGLGIYLPPGTILPVVVGAVLGHFYNRHAARAPNPEATRRLGVLLASGLIVGESLFGVLNAGIIVIRGSPFTVVGDSFATASNVLGAIAFAVTIAALYSWIARVNVGKA